MSNYTPITDFSVKDGLTTGNAAKLIMGVDFDGEFDAIKTAVDSKMDSNFLGLGSLADPDDDRILFWDDSAGAFAWLNMTNLTSGVAIVGTELNLAIGSMTADVALPWQDPVVFYDTSGLHHNRVVLEDLFEKWTAWVNADDAINNDATPNVDDTLTITDLVAANHYAVTACIRYDQADANPDGLKLGINEATTGTQGLYAWTWTDNTAVTMKYSENNNQVACTDSHASGNERMIQMTGHITNSTSCSIKWSQGVSHASLTTLRQGSWLRVEKIS